MMGLMVVTWDVVMLFLLRNGDDKSLKLSLLPLVANNNREFQCESHMNRIWLCLVSEVGRVELRNFRGRVWKS